MDVLVVRPKFDEATDETFKFAEEILKWCKDAGIPTRDMAIGDATRLPVEVALVENPRIYVHYDHGSADALIGNDSQPVIDISNCQILADKEVYTLACLSAKSLGVEIWRKGGKFWGYNQIVSFTTDALEEFQQAFNSGFKLRFIEGKTHEEALEGAREVFDDLALQLVSTGNTIGAICMRANRSSLRCFNAQAPDSECSLRRMLLRNLGPERGWAVPSPRRVKMYLKAWLR